MAASDHIWNALQDRWAVGDLLTPNEEAERLRLAAQDPAARRELEVFRTLHVSLDSEQLSAAEATLMDRVLWSARLCQSPPLRLVSAQAKGRPVAAKPAVVAPAPRSHARRIAPWAGAALAIAAAAWLLLRPQDPEPLQAALPPAPPTAPASAPELRSELVLASGEVRVDEHPAEVGRSTLNAGQRVATHRGRACLTIDPAIDLCLAEQTQVILESLTQPAVRVRITGGQAVAKLDSRPAEAAFSLVAADVVATAQGTVFALEHRADQQATSVVVLEGSVRVAQGAQAPVRVPAHTRIELSAKATSPHKTAVGRGEEGGLWAQISSRSLWHSPELGMVRIEQSDEYSEVRIGESGPLPLPLQAFVPTGTQRVTARGESGSEHHLQLVITAGQKHKIDVSDAPTKASPPASGSTKRSARALLDAARERTRQGDPQGALALYRKLRANHPGSPEASTVLVTMGKLELNVRSPSRALTAFETYLRRAGPLAPEALGGKIRAFRALGQQARERRAIEQYIAQYPQGFEAPSLRERLRALAAR